MLSGKQKVLGQGAWWVVRVLLLTACRVWGQHSLDDGGCDEGAYGEAVGVDGWESRGGGDADGGEGEGFGDDRHGGCQSRYGSVC